MEARTPGQFFLRNPKMVPPVPNRGPKVLFNVSHSLVAPTRVALFHTITQNHTTDYE